MRLSIKHVTSFQYEVGPSYGLLQVRKTPQSSAAQNVVDWDLSFVGAEPQANFIDQHGNRVDLIEVLPDVETIELHVNGTVETLMDDGVLGADTAPMPLWFYLRQTKLTDAGHAIDDLIKDMPTDGAANIASFHELSERVRARVTYTPGETGVATTAADALAAGKGVCQDHTHIFLSAARKLGVPGRYVSGYLMMTDRTDQDASHAWAEVHLDGLGWVGFDVSNGISPDQKYVRIAQGLDYADIAPTKGVMRGGLRENLFVSIQVQQ
ncbi:MAG: transglutaminase family protein [Hyphomonadaceae bacterium]|nr:transglutaminase family protein [Hyphomonadaceae bacterium]